MAAESKHSQNGASSIIYTVHILRYSYNCFYTKVRKFRNIPVPFPWVCWLHDVKLTASEHGN